MCTGPIQLCHHRTMQQHDKQNTMFMSNNSDEPASEELLNILRTSNIPLSTREVSARLRFRRLRISDYEVGNLLRNLLVEGKVDCKTGRWTALILKEKTYPSSMPTLPPLSNETQSLLGFKTLVDREDIEPDQKDIGPDSYTGRWRTFRRLLKYYRQCIQQEEGADASAFQNELG